MASDGAAADKPATIYDVARVAGVSHQTVSRYLQGFEGIRPATKDRVVQALDELDYRPNQAARALRTNRSNRIGALAHELAETGPARIIQGAIMGAREAGYMLDIVSMDGASEKSIKEALEVLSQQQVAGVFATAQNDTVKAALESFPLSVPIFIDVRMDSGLPGLSESVADTTGRLAAEHLIGLGHRRFAFVSGPAAWFSSRDRFAGFLAVIREVGGECPVIIEGDWSPQSGYDASQQFPVDQGITAVMIANDDMAIGFLRGLADRGIRVPEDISVMGVDDNSEARFLSPSLSTIRIDFESEGRNAIRWLIDEIEGRERSSAPEFALAELVARESTRPPRGQSG